MRLIMAAGLSLALCGMTGASVARTPAAAPAKPANQCFYSHDWDGWKATPDSKSIYIRVGISKYYRIDFSSACPALNMINAHLITHPVNDLICSAIDLDISVSNGDGLNGGGFKVPCIAQSITPMTAADVAALPKNLKP